MIHCKIYREYDTLQNLQRIDSLLQKEEPLTPPQLIVLKKQQAVLKQITEQSIPNIIDKMAEDITEVRVAKDISPEIWDKKRQLVRLVEKTQARIRLQDTSPVSPTTSRASTGSSTTTTSRASTGSPTTSGTYPLSSTISRASTDSSPGLSTTSRASTDSSPGLSTTSEASVSAAGLRQGVLSIQQQDIGNIEAVIYKTYEQHPELMGVTQNQATKIIHPSGDEAVQIYKGPEYTVQDLRTRRDKIFLLGQHKEDGRNIWIEVDTGSKASGRGKGASKGASAEVSDQQIRKLKKWMGKGDITKIQKWARRHYQNLDLDVVYPAKELKHPPQTTQQVRLADGTMVTDKDQYQYIISLGKGVGDEQLWVRLPEETGQKWVDDKDIKSIVRWAKTKYPSMETRLYSTAKQIMRPTEGQKVLLADAEKVTPGVPDTSGKTPIIVSVGTKHAPSKDDIWIRLPQEAFHEERSTLTSDVSTDKLSVRAEGEGLKSSGVSEEALGADHLSSRTKMSDYTLEATTKPSPKTLVPEPTPLPEASYRPPTAGVDTARASDESTLSSNESIPSSKTLTAKVGEDTTDFEPESGTPDHKAIRSLKKQLESIKNEIEIFRSSYNSTKEGLLEYLQLLETKESTVPGRNPAIGFGDSKTLKGAFRRRSTAKSMQDWKETFEEDVAPWKLQIDTLLEQKKTIEETLSVVRDRVRSRYWKLKSENPNAAQKYFNDINLSDPDNARVIEEEALSHMPEEVVKQVSKLRDTTEISSPMPEEVVKQVSKLRDTTATSSPMPEEVVKQVSKFRGTTETSSPKASRASAASLHQSRVLRGTQQMSLSAVETRTIHPSGDEAVQIYKGPEYTAQDVLKRRENIFLLGQDENGEDIWVEVDTGSKASGRGKGASKGASAEVSDQQIRKLKKWMEEGDITKIQKWARQHDKNLDVAYPAKELTHPPQTTQQVRLADGTMVTDKDQYQYIVSLGKGGEQLWVRLPEETGQKWIDDKDIKSIVRWAKKEYPSVDAWLYSTTKQIMRPTDGQEVLLANAEKVTSGVPDTSGKTPIIVSVGTKNTPSKDDIWIRLPQEAFHEERSTLTSAVSTDKLSVRAESEGQPSSRISSRASSRTPETQGTPGTPEAPGTPERSSKGSAASPPTQEQPQAAATTQEQSQTATMTPRAEPEKAADKAKAELREAFEEFQREQYQEILKTNPTAANEHLRNLYNKDPEMAWRLDSERVDNMKALWNKMKAIRAEDELAESVPERIPSPTTLEVEPLKPRITRSDYTLEAAPLHKTLVSEPTPPLRSSHSPSAGVDLAGVASKPTSKPTPSSSPSSSRPISAVSEDEGLQSSIVSEEAFDQALYAVQDLQDFQTRAAQKLIATHTTHSEVGVVYPPSLEDIQGHYKAALKQFIQRSQQEAENFDHHKLEITRGLLQKYHQMARTFEDTSLTVEEAWKLQLENIAKGDLHQLELAPSKYLELIKRDIFVKAPGLNLEKPFYGQRIHEVSISMSQDIKGKLDWLKLINDDDIKQLFLAQPEYAHHFEKELEVLGQQKAVRAAFEQWSKEDVGQEAVVQPLHAVEDIHIFQQRTVQRFLQIQKLRDSGRFFPSLEEAQKSYKQGLKQFIEHSSQEATYLEHQSVIVNHLLKQYHKAARKVKLPSDVELTLENAWTVELEVTAKQQLNKFELKPEKYLESIKTEFLVQVPDLNLEKPFRSPPRLPKDTIKISKIRSHLTHLEKLSDDDIRQLFLDQPEYADHRSGRKWEMEWEISNLERELKHQISDQQKTSDTDQAVSDTDQAVRDTDQAVIRIWDNPKLTPSDMTELEVLEDKLHHLAAQYADDHVHIKAQKYLESFVNTKPKLKQGQSTSPRVPATRPRDPEFVLPEEHVKRLQQKLETLEKKSHKLQLDLSEFKKSPSWEKATAIEHTRSQILQQWEDIIQEDITWDLTRYHFQVSRSIGLDKTPLQDANGLLIPGTKQILQQPTFKQLELVVLDVKHQQVDQKYLDQLGKKYTKLKGYISDLEPTIQVEPKVQVDLTMQQKAKRLYKNLLQKWVKTEEPSAATVQPDAIPDAIYGKRVIQLMNEAHREVVTQLQWIAKQHPNALSQETLKSIRELNSLPLIRELPEHHIPIQSSDGRIVIFRKDIADELESTVEGTLQQRMKNMRWILSQNVTDQQRAFELTSSYESQAPILEEESQLEKQLDQWFTQQKQVQQRLETEVKKYKYIPPKVLGIEDPQSLSLQLLQSSGQVDPQHVSQWSVSEWSIKLFQRRIAIQLDRQPHESWDALKASYEQTLEDFKGMLEKRSAELQDQLKHLRKSHAEAEAEYQILLNKQEQLQQLEQYQEKYHITESLQEKEKQLTKSASLIEKAKKKSVFTKRHLDILAKKDTDEEIDQFLTDTLGTHRKDVLISKTTPLTLEERANLVELLRPSTRRKIFLQSTKHLRPPAPPAPQSPATLPRIQVSPSTDLLPPATPQSPATLPRIQVSPSTDLLPPATPQSPATLPRIQVSPGTDLLPPATPQSPEHLASPAPQSLATLPRGLKASRHSEDIEALKNQMSPLKTMFDSRYSKEIEALQTQIIQVKEMLHSEITKVNEAFLLEELYWNMWQKHKDWQQNVYEWEDLVVKQGSELVQNTSKEMELHNPKYWTMVKRNLALRVGLDELHQIVSQDPQYLPKALEIAQKDLGFRGSVQKSKLPPKFDDKTLPIGLHLAEMKAYQKTIDDEVRFFEGITEEYASMETKGRPEMRQRVEQAQRDMVKIGIPMQNYLQHSSTPRIKTAMETLLLDPR